MSRDPDPLSAAAAPRADPTQLLDLPPLTALLRLGVPTTAVMLVATVSNVAHAYFVSWLGADAIAAVSLIFPISLLAQTIMVGGIGTGVAAAIARALGSGAKRQAIAVAEHALALGVLAGLAFGALVFFGAESLFRVMGGSPEVVALAVPYAHLLFGGAVIPFAGAMFDSIMRGEGEVRVPATWSTVSLVLQMGVTPLFMFGIGFGLIGAPLAMLTCQATTLIARARHVLGGRGIVQPASLPMPPDGRPIRRILSVGIPASLATAVNYLGIIVLTGVVARYGDGHLAAYGLAVRMDFILLSLAYGCGAAVLTLVGLASGAGRPELVRTYVLRAGVLMVGVLALFAVLLMVRPDVWMRIFSDNVTIGEVGAAYFRIVAPTYPLMGISMVIAFAFQALGRATVPLIVMVVRVTGLIGAALVLSGFGYSERSVFLAIAITNGSAAVVLSALFVRSLATRQSPGGS